MSKKKQFSDKLKDDFKHLFRSGEHSQVELRQVLGLSEHQYSTLKRELFPNIRKKKKEYKRAKAKFVELCQAQKYSIADVCEALGIARTTYYNWRRELLPPTYRKNQEQYREFVALYETEAFSLSRIAQMMGCHTGSVSRYKARYLRENAPQSATDSTLPQNGQVGPAAAPMDEPPGSQG